MEIDISKSCSEANVILSKLDEKYYEKISKNFLRFLENNEDKEYKKYFTENEEKIKISRNAQILLALVYRSYFCNEEQRAKYDNILRENQEKIDKERRAKYDVKEIFEKRKNRNVNNDNEQIIQKDVQLVIQKKENILVRLFKYVFKKNSKKL